MLNLLTCAEFLYLTLSDSAVKIKQKACFSWNKVETVSQNQHPILWEFNSFLKKNLLNIFSFLKIKLKLKFHLSIFFLSKNVIRLLI